MKMFSQGSVSSLCFKSLPLSYSQHCVSGACLVSVVSNKHSLFCLWCLPNVDGILTNGGSDDEFEGDGGSASNDEQSEVDDDTDSITTNIPLPGTYVRM